MALLFGSVTLLTPHPVSIVGNELIIIKPISSLNGYGSIRIDISSQVPVNLGVFNSWDEAHLIFPPNSIKAVLYQDSGKYSVSLIYTGNVTYDNNGTQLVLEPLGKIPTNEHFDRLRIVTNNPLHLVKIYWKNVSDK
jgi:hypothetical protein